MDCKKNIAFFKQTDFFRILGAALLIIGLAWFWAGQTMLSYYAPCVLVPVGLVMFIVTSIRNVSETEVKEATENAMEGLGDDVEGDADFSRKILTSPAPFTAEGALYLEKAAYFRRGKNSTVLSDVYVKSKLYFSGDRLLIRSRQICLTSGEIQDVVEDILWENVGTATLETYRGNVKLSNARNSMASVHGMILKITDPEGNLIFQAPIHDDMDAEDFKNAFNKFSAQAKA